MVEIQKTRCGGRNTENLIKSTCFHLEISQVHMFYLNFNRVHIFFDGDNSKLVPESTHSGVPNLHSVDSIKKNQKVKI